MSMRTQSHQAKVPGTRYVCALEIYQGQWVLRLKLGDSVEAEIPLYKLSRRTIHEGIGALLAQQQIQVNELIHEQITNQIVSQLGPLLKEDRSSGISSGSADTVTSSDLETRILDLEKRIAALEEKVEMLSKNSSSETKIH